MELGSRRPIVLASRSPRRLELARGAGWTVTVAPAPESAEGDEPPRGPDEPLERYVTRLARAKAKAVARVGHPGEVSGTILACDTLSEVDGVALGKPADREDARRMLVRLSGRRHRVVTGVCLWQRPQLEPLESAVESVLEMGPLSEAFLQWYLDSGMWRGKAGACGFQDERLPLRLVAGSPSNVVGLPLEAIGDLLREVDGMLAAAMPAPQGSRRDDERDKKTDPRGSADGGPRGSVE
ncbi:MAG: Maf-like protein [Planctomycetia bacterium]|nr:Maf-like protein [Planctomycetia bacterium]